MRLIKLLLLITFITSVLSSPLKQKFSERSASIRADPAEYRLPPIAKPLSYDISLVVDPEADHFSGEAKIQIRSLTNGSRVVLHAKELNISTTVVRDDGGQMLNIVNITRSMDDKHFYIIDLSSNLVEDRLYDLQFVYNASYGNIFGLYKSSYVDVNGTTRYLAMTQLGITEARSVFPCYDEPALKAVFNVHIYAPRKYYAVCNMDVIPSNKPPMTGFEVTSFRPSVTMSSYLVAFFVSDFSYKSNTRDGPLLFPKEFRVYARPTASDYLQQALETGQRSMQFLQAYIDVAYRLPKIDNMAAPDFSFGAMENWGVIMYGEQNLIYERGESTTQAKTRTSTIMSHELAHFWFGDEVSPLWWDYTWLSEGFATFFEHYTTENIMNGEWRNMDQFVVNDLHRVMNDDSLPTTHPMNNIVVTPAEILNNFDSINYLKAGSVIRMMQHILGEGTFRFALSTYVKSLPMGSGTPEKLFTEMQKVVPAGVLPNNITINDVFGSWARQAGYPVIYAERYGSTIEIRQERFYQNSSLSSNESWWIPLTWASHLNPDFKNTSTQQWLRPNDSKSELNINSNNNWFIINKQQSGYYRVMYDWSSWKALSSVLTYENHSLIHPLNRAQLIDDAFTFSNTGRMTFNVTFNILEYLSQELDWIPWIPANRVLSFLNIRMAASEDFLKYSLFENQLVKNVFNSVGLEVKPDDTYVTKRLRPLVANLACTFGVQSCLESGMNQLNSFLETGVKIDPDIRGVVYCGGLRTGTQDMWNRLFEKYGNHTDASEDALIIQALGCTYDFSLLDTYLRMTTFNQSLLKTEDVESVVLSVVNQGPIGVDRVLYFINYDFLRLRDRLILQPFGTRRIIERLGQVICKDDHVDAFQNFTMNYGNMLFPEERVSLERAWRSLSVNQRWLADNLEDIESWLNEKIPSSSGRVLGRATLIISFLVMLMFYY